MPTIKETFSQDDQPCIDRHFIPGPAFQGSSRSLFLNPTPLLEEERNACIQALIPYFRNPFRIKRTRAWARFPTNDCPIDASQVKFPQRPKQWFQRKKLHMRPGFPEIVDPVCIFLTFDANAHPNLRHPVQLPAQLEQSLGTFGQNLILMPVRRAHDLEDSPNKICRHILVE
jgi:hypothetical protein